MGILRVSPLVFSPGYIIYNTRPQCRLPGNIRLPSSMNVSPKRGRAGNQAPPAATQGGDHSESDTGRSADDDDETDSDESAAKPAIEDSSS